MIKNLNKSLCLTVITAFAIGQLGCSPPGTSTGNNNTPTGTNSNVKVIAKENKLLLTQKNAQGEINPVVPEDLESITINGKVYKAADIKIEKGMNTKASDYLLKFVDGKFVIQGTDGDVQLNISFKLKDTTNPIILPDFAIASLTGDLRVEVEKNDKGEVIGFKGGINKDGGIDPSKPMFKFDPVTGKLDVIADGQKSTFILELADVKTELKIKTDAVKTELTPEELKAAQEGILIGLLSPGAAFVGKWKYNDILGTSLRLTLREGSANTLNYSAKIGQAIQNFSGDFSGNVKYSSAGVNSLNIESAVNGKNIKGKIDLVGDNSLNFTLNSSEISQLASFAGQSVNLSRDVE
jgi:hypothetical protein